MDIDNGNDNDSAPTNAARTRNRAIEPLLHGFLSGQVLACFYRVYNGLGFGFLESVYCNALAHEFQKAGIPFVREAPVDVWYDGKIVGQFRADFSIDQKIVLEVKASQAIGEADRKQLLNCLRCSDVELGLLLHFGPRPSHQRLVYSNDRKGR